MRTLIITLISLLVVGASAQTTFEEVAATPEKSGGVYYAYPLDFAPQTPAPKGYKPVYISHYGRHGSRYLLNDRDYKWVIELLQQAADVQVLSSLGHSALERLQEVWKEAEFHGDELAPLGERQHRGIAERMFASFPEVFKGDARVFARSTTSMRCRNSMDAFVDRLRELNPRLQIRHETKRVYMSYLNYHSPEHMSFNDGPWKELYRKFQAEHTHPERMMEALFNDPTWVRWNVNPDELMWGFYWIASDMQDMECDISFYDIFTPQELFDLWQCFNFRFYAADADWTDNHGLALRSCHPLLRNILECADAALDPNNVDRVVADLRFGHDGNVIPLCALLGLDGCTASTSDPNDFYKVWSDFKVSPMGANIQLIFYRRKGSDDVLVKFLHNEHETSIPVVTDCLPYYHWNDVRAYWLSLLQ